MDDEKSNALEIEASNPTRVRPKHPTHQRYNHLTKDEEHAAAGYYAKTGKVRKAKRYDGRALRHIRTRTEVAMKTFYEEVDLPEFKKALQFNGDPKFQMLLGAISSPSLRNCSFIELCRRCNLSINDITGLWRNHQLQRGMMRMMKHMPDVLEDVAIDARSRVVPCDACEGTGKVDRTTMTNDGEGPKKTGTKQGICRTCHGDGVVRIIGDKDARWMAFKGSGFIREAAQPAVNVNIGALPSLEAMVQQAEEAMDIEAKEVVDGRVADSGGERRPETVDPNGGAPGGAAGEAAAAGSEREACRSEDPDDPAGD